MQSLDQQAFIQAIFNIEISPICHEITMKHVTSHTSIDCLHFRHQMFCCLHVYFECTIEVNYCVICLLLFFLQIVATLQSHDKVPCLILFRYNFVPTFWSKFGAFVLYRGQCLMFIYICCEKKSYLFFVCLPTQHFSTPLCYMHCFFSLLNGIGGKNYLIFYFNIGNDIVQR